MSIAMAGLGNFAFSSKDRLRKALKENTDSYTISKDGHVQLNLNDEKVIEAIKEQIKLLEQIQEDKRNVG
ncbi:TPA: multidrug ABC transporter ATPase [Serratia marcescens]|nr:multidrug ABC transporter ATPase [Serratia marcescens]HCR3026323.1 multidrug ABC transporter ATPase [Serratia marcescens]